MTDFDIFGKIFIILVFLVNFSQKCSFIEKWHNFLFSICFLIFCRNYVNVSQQKAKITSLLDRICAPNLHRDQYFLPKKFQRYDTLGKTDMNEET